MGNESGLGGTPEKYLVALLINKAMGLVNKLVDQACALVFWNKIPEYLIFQLDINMVDQLSCP